MLLLLMMMHRWQVGSADNDDVVGLLCKMCDIYGSAFTTKLQKRIWHVTTAVINSAEYVPHV